MGRWSSTLTLLLVLILCGCGHSPTYLVTGQGSNEPLLDSSEVRLTYGAGYYFGLNWSEDGRTLLFGDSTRLSPNSCRSIAGSDTRKSGCVNDSCLDGMPANGGSGLLHFCDIRGGHPDSTDLITGAALGSDGRLLFDEVSGRRDFEFPIGYHAELWLADSGTPNGPRRRLRSMSSEGFVLVLSATKWLSPTEFVAYERSVSASQNVGVQLVGLVHGVIQPDTTLLSTIPSTRGVRAFSAAQAGASVVYSTGDLVLHRVSLADGSVTSAGVLPAAPGRSVQDIRCERETCLVVTDDSIPIRPTYSLWQVVVGGSVTLQRTLQPSVAFGTVAIGTEGRLAVTHGGVVYLVRSAP